MAIFLTKKHLSRRTFLRGSGVALGLPFLDAMVPAATALAQTAAAPKTRAGFFYLPHGAIMNNTPYGKEVDVWTSTGKGADFTLGQTVAPLDPLKNYVTTFENIENTRRRRLGAHAQSGDLAVLRASGHRGQGRQHGHHAGPGDRAAAGAEDRAAVAGSRPPKPPSRWPRAAVRAATTRPRRPMPAPNTPLPMEYNPRKVFIQLMGEGDTAAERDALLRKNASILDMISERAKSLRNDLGPGRPGERCRTISTPCARSSGA